MASRAKQTNSGMKSFSFNLLLFMYMKLKKETSFKAVVIVAFYELKSVVIEIYILFCAKTI